MYCIWVKISIWCIGKTDEKYLIEGIDKYLLRLKHYGATPDETTKREAELVFSKLKSDDVLILLDEHGEMYDSVKFARYIEKLQVNAHKNVIFLIGGAFGHHKTVRARADHQVSLSKMTFSHQMVRLFLTEQIYRAFTILRNEKYHNE